MEIVDSRPGYRFRLFEKCGTAMIVDGSGDDRITLEGLGKPSAFMDAEDSSDNERASKTANDGCGGDDDQAVGAGRRAWGVGARVTTAGRTWTTATPATKTMTASLIFTSKSLIFPCVVVLLLPLLVFT